MLNGMATGAKRDESFQPLDVLFIVVVPNLMALDGMFAANASANLADMPRRLVGLSAQLVPHLARDVAAHVGKPATRGN